MSGFSYGNPRPAAGISRWSGPPYANNLPPDRTNQVNGTPYGNFSYPNIPNMYQASSTIPPRTTTYHPHLGSEEEKAPVPYPSPQSQTTLSRNDQKELEELRLFKQDIQRRALLRRLTNPSESQIESEESQALASYINGYEGSPNMMKAGTWKDSHSFKSSKKNYYPWYIRIIQFLKQRKLDLLAQGKIVPNEKWSLESLERYAMDLEIVKNALIQSVDDEVVQATSRANHPHEILDYMRATYADITEVQKQNSMYLYEMSNLR
jgi:hypothetical protein